MVVDFDCFLIDAIITVGDQRFRDRCQYELFEKRKDHAMIMVSHDTGFIREHCQHASVLVRGKLSSFDDLDQAFDYYNEHAAEVTYA
jgi:capsular polysaccharide transport system ATP-binding protein